MICSTCHAPLPYGARFCSHCGTTAPAFTVQPVVVDRVSSHLQTLGVLWLVYSVLRVVKGLTGAFIVHGFLHPRVFGPFAADAWPHPFVLGLWPFVWTSLVLSVAAAGITAYALLTRQPWGRVIAIVFACFALLHPLLGTALGIYTLWVLAPRSAALAYGAATAQRV